jgi:hypothetical protein
MDLRPGDWVVTRYQFGENTIGRVEVLYRFDVGEAASGAFLTDDRRHVTRQAHYTRYLARYNPSNEEIAEFMLRQLEV